MVSGTADKAKGLLLSDRNTRVTGIRESHGFPELEDMMKRQNLRVYKAE